MKFLIIILAFICIEVYSQPAIKVCKTDSDSLWQDLKWSFPDIEKDEFSMRYTESDNVIVFHKNFACDLKDLEPLIQEKIRKRFGHTNNR